MHGKEGGGPGRRAAGALLGGLLALGVELLVLLLGAVAIANGVLREDCALQLTAAACVLGGLLGGRLACAWWPDRKLPAGLAAGGICFLLILCVGLMSGESFSLGLQALLEPQALPGLQAPQDQLAPLGLQALLEPLGLRDPQGQPDPLEPPGLQALLEPLGLRDPLEPPGLQAPPDQQGPLGLQAPQDQRAAPLPQHFFPPTPPPPRRAATTLPWNLTRIQRYPALTFPIQPAAAILRYPAPACTPPRSTEM